MYVKERGCILGAPSFSPYRHWVSEHRRGVGDGLRVSNTNMGYSMRSEKRLIFEHEDENEADGSLLHQPGSQIDRQR